jgi:glycosyltransferase involved in cell wall biosynthesis
VQGKSLLPRLADLPEFGGRQNIAQFAWYGLQGGMHNVEGFRIYPAGMDHYGNDVIGSHTKDFGANIVVSLIDVWVMRDTAQSIAPALWLPWLPIDHDPVPEPVLNSLKGAHMPLTYSKWGHDLLKATGVDNHYIPHGIEPNTYRVNPDVASIKKFKAELLRCNGHLSVMVAANKGYPDRKAFQVQLRAWANFAKDKPDARLYIHTEPTPMYGGVDLPKLATNLGIDAKVIFPDRYQYYKGLPAEYLAMVYNAADVLMANSMSEGFGIPIIEAQACGTPVITTDFSSMPELVRWGYKIAPADMFWTPMGAWQAWPDVRGITDALNEQYEQWAGGWSMSQRLKVSAAIHNEFSWDSIVRDQWAPFVAKIADVAPPLAGNPAPVKPAPKTDDTPVISRKPTRKPKIEIVTPESVGVNGRDYAPA